MLYPLRASLDNKYITKYLLIVELTIINKLFLFHHLFSFTRRPRKRLSNKITQLWVLKSLTILLIGLWRLTL